MKLSHFAAKPLPTRLHNVEQGPLNGVGGYFAQKPGGLWVSVDGKDDWPEWCESNNFSLYKLRYRYRITLRKRHDLIVISTAAALDSFVEQFGVADPLFKDMAMYNDCRGINWPRVAQTAKGIIIAPYHWTRRMDSMWYYTWDCASGCIWDVSAIQSVRLMSMRPRCRHTKWEHRAYIAARDGSALKFCTKCGQPRKVKADE